MTTLTKDLFESMKEELCGIESTYVELKDGFGVNVIQLNTEGAIALANMSEADNANMMIKWVAACCVDDDMNPVFTVEDVLHLPQALSQKLISAVIDVNDLLQKNNTDEAEKN